MTKSGSFELIEGETSRAILDAFREVHRRLGFGYRELQLPVSRR
jgi:hypothetical protein